MMGKLQEALTQLKNELINIASNRKLTRNMAGLQGENNLKLAHLPYGNLAILPNDFAVADNSFINSNNTDYSRKVLQATFNILDILAAGNIATLRNRDILQENFNFLDNVTLVPKIIDPVTFKIGQALQRTLHSVLSNEKLLNEIPDFFGSRKKIIDKLTTIKPILDKRLTIYETHTPEYIATIKKWNNICTEIDSLEQRINKELIDHEAFQQPIIAILNQDVTGDISTIQAMIDNLTSNNKALAISIEGLTQLNNTLSKKITDNRLPSIIMISSLAHLLINYPSEQQSPGQLTREWSNLYQNDELKFYREDIAHSLENTQKKNQSILNQLASYQNNYPTQLSILQKRLEQEKEYASHQNLLNEANELKQNTQKTHEAILADDEERLQQDFTALRLAQAEVLHIQASHDTYNNERYKPNITRIKETYNPKLAELTLSIKKLNKKIKTRQSFIDQANQELSKYINLLNNNTAFYFPTNKITEKTLITYLETDKDNNDAISIIYKKAIEGNTLSRFGFTHIRNRILNNRLFGNAFSDDCNHIKTLINNKLRSLNEGADAISLAKDKTTKLALEQNKIALNTQKNAELGSINEEYKQSIATLALAKYNASLKGIKHQQTLIMKNIHALDFDLIEIETSQKTLESILQETPIANLTMSQLQSLKEKFEHLNHWTNEKRPRYNLSPLALNKQINHTVISSKEDWKVIHQTVPASDEGEKLYKEFTTLTSTLNQLNLFFSDLSERTANTMRTFKRDIALRSFELEITQPLLEKYGQLHDEINAINELPTNKRTYEKQTSVLTKINEIIIAIKQAKQHNMVITNKIPGFLEKIERISDEILIIQKEVSTQLPSATPEETHKILHQTYFGKYFIEAGGIFGNYLKERANTFWKSDLFESFVSLMTGMNYRSNATKRTEYISELQWLSCAHYKDPDNVDTKNRLLKKIRDGILEFKPRNPSEPDSLRSKLQAFETALNSPVLNEAPSNTQYTRQ